MRKYFILALSLVVMVIAACSKKATPSVASRMDMLRTGQWHVASGTLTCKLPNGNDTVLNYLNWIPVCNRDDYYKFNTGLTGAVFSGGVKCNIGDPDSISFGWKLTNGDNYLSINNSFYFYHSVTETILPFVFDTLSHTPLVLDTLHGVNDTAAGHTRSVIVLDTIWSVHFDTTGVVNTDIANGVISNFSANSFTLYFTLLASHPDSTNFHTGKYFYTDPVTGNIDSADFNPITRPDTFKYSITYSH